MQGADATYRLPLIDDDENQSYEVAFTERSSLFVRFGLGLLSS
jgi:hypothetical protein